MPKTINTKAARINESTSMGKINKTELTRTRSELEKDTARNVRKIRRVRIKDKLAEKNGSKPSIDESTTTKSRQFHASRR